LVKADLFVCNSLLLVKEGGARHSRGRFIGSPVKRQGEGSRRPDQVRKPEHSVEVRA
jgi:hypothetical protein